ncbi:MAG: 50S ribosomal protein L32 [Candidatus Cloacimonadota bacterium]|nr:MAG: 50S ribosomal protein L32 [Candidatus Cloacimonadota bacterium]
MAVPKRKTSKSRRDKRRTHYKATVPTTTVCSNCGEQCRPHNVCAKCGHYNGKKVLEVKE